MSGRTDVAIAARLARTARELHGHGSVQETLRAIVDSARGVIEGCDHAGVTVLGRGGAIESPACTDPLVLELDRLQGALDQGPCLDVMRGQALLRIDDTAREQRWPAFSRGAEELGVGSMLACRLAGSWAPTAALNLHSGRRSAFDDGTAQIAVVYAAHATLALANAGLVASLRQSMDNRQAIGEATGILMERHRITSRQSFELLVAASQRLNVKLRVVAAQVVDTGEDPRSIRREQLPPFQ
ncbi:GAF and ANTAR domain-containing protein [Streptacidiphilus sp. PAMC 29251]